MKLVTVLLATALLGAAQGKVSKHVLAAGKYFPGTPHNYAVYVPAQYDAAKATPLMIFLDGSGALGGQVKAPAVLDELIGKKELPPLIGIFVDPGVLPAAREGAQSRFERVFEYDSLSDRYARFLVEELIPEVGKRYNLSANPNDRGLYGVSTGAVGALVAAWQRPDQFRRVLSFIGTFVAMKGGDTLAGLIRRSEAKPLRVFLQAGRNDHIAPSQPYGTFYAGSWPVNNQVMYDAMRFAGYDVRFELGNEGHNMKHGAAILPEALRWLWREYPAPIVVREPAGLNGPDWDPRGKVSSIVAASEEWKLVGGTQAAGLTVGPDGTVYFADGGKLMRVDAAGSASVFREAVGTVTALAAGADGRVYVANAAGIASYGSTGGGKAVAKGVAATGLAVTAKGEVYFADGNARRVGWVDAHGKVGTVQGVEMASPAGVALSPDQAMVVVTDAGARFSWSFQIAADGGLKNGEPFFRLEMPEEGWRSEVRGAALDAIGQVYFATRLGVQMCEANGRVAALLHAPGGRGGVRAVAFGGAGFAWMYVIREDGKVFRRKVKVTGANVGTVGALPKPPL